MAARLEWKGREVREAFAGCLNLQEMVERVETEACSHGAVVCEVWINKIRLDEAAEKRLANCRPEEIQSLAVVTEDRSQVVKDLFKSVDDYLPRLLTGTEQAAEELRIDAKPVLIRQLPEIFEGTSWMVESFKRLAIALENRWGENLQTQWKKAETQLVKVLTQLLDAFSKRDFVLLADLLEYELTNCLQEWIGVIQSSVQCFDNATHSLD